MNVLFVCTGNTCRSPMAAGYLNDKKIPHLTVNSRGLAANGDPISENAETVMRESGIDLSGHISATVTPDDLKTADLIICLSDSHREVLERIGVPAKKLLLLGGGISDPFGGNLTVYRQCRDEIFKAVDRLVNDGIFTPFRIVPMDESHLSQIERLEKLCFSEPWSKEALSESYAAGTKFFVAAKGSTVLGYIGITAMLDEGYFTNIAVFPDARRNGVGILLIDRAIQFAREYALSFLSLEVRRSNLPAVNLYQKFGFMPEGERRNFYRNPTEDAIIMTKRFKIQDENNQY